MNSRKKKIAKTITKKIIKTIRESLADCNICYEKLDENVVKLVPCKHYYHKKCIDQWRRNNNTCPSCRSVIESTEIKNIKSHFKPYSTDYIPVYASDSDSDIHTSPAASRPPPFDRGTPRARGKKSIKRKSKRRKSRRRRKSRPKRRKSRTRRRNSRQ